MLIVPLAIRLTNWSWTRRGRQAEARGSEAIAAESEILSSCKLYVAFELEVWRGGRDVEAKCRRKAVSPRWRRLSSARNLLVHYFDQYRFCEGRI
jgi:hypothetical protein